jgi:hypothetical protein
MPLAWFGFGSVRDLREMPLTLLNRYILLMEEEDAVSRYWSYRDPGYGSRRRGR